jgi:hypothetical protein
MSLNTSPPTAWWWNIGLDFNGLGNLVSQNNALPVLIRPYWDAQQSQPGIYYAAIVAQYENDTPRWWYCGASPDEIGNLLAQNNAMPYSVAADSTGLCSIMVPAQDSWWWLYDSSADNVGNTLSDTGASLTWISGTNDSFYAVMNSPGSPYWWFDNLPLSQIGTQLEATGGQLLSLDATWQDGDNEPTFAVLIGPQDGSTSWWYYDLHETDVSAALTENNAYLIDIAPYNHWAGAQIVGHDETLMAVVMRAF